MSSVVVTWWRKTSGRQRARPDHAGTPAPFQLARVQPSVGFPLTTTCAVLGSGLSASARFGFLTFIRTQYRMASRVTPSQPMVLEISVMRANFDWCF